MGGGWWSFGFDWAVLPVYFGLIFYCVFTRICKNVLLAPMGSTFLKSGPQHFTSKKPFFGPPSGKKMRQFCHFRPHRILKIRRKNEYNLFMDPFGFELGAKLVLPVCLDGPSGWFGLMFYRMFTRF